MEDLQEWIKTELFPGLWEKLDFVFPERKLSRSGGKWISPTYLDGSEHSRRDKCWISMQTPWLLHEQGGGSKRLVDCYMESNNLGFMDALKQLSRIAGLTLPRGRFDVQEWRRGKEQQTLREDMQEYFTWNLFNSAYGKAQEVLKYLKEERGYPEQKIKAMGLGVIPSQATLKKYLTEKLHYSEGKVDEVLKRFNGWIGDTHKLSIPIRAKSNIIGFTFRQTAKGDITRQDGSKVGKYQVESGMDRSSSFFYISPLKGDKDLVLVEGELDALAAQAEGLSQVVAIGGNGSITKERVEDALRRGARNITICLDRAADEKKKAEQEQLIAKGIDAALEAGCSRVYVASLPEIEEDREKTDADSLIRYKGADALRKVIAEAAPFWQYELNNTYQEFAALENQEGRGKLTEKQVDALLDRMLTTLDRVPGEIEKDRFIKQAGGVLEALGIKRESFLDAAEQISRRRKEQRESKLLSSTLSKATTLQQEGRTEEAQSILRRGLSAMAEQGVQDLAATLIPTTLQELKERAAATPGSIGSGFYLSKDVEITFAGGALSVVAAPTSHGKTTFMLNVLLNLAQDKRYQGKKWVVLSYEEPRDRMYQYLLNIYTNAPLNALADRNRELIAEYFQTNQQPEYMSRDGYNLLKRAENEFFNLKRLQERILITDTKLNSEEVAEDIKYLARRGDVGGLFVDYFQYLKLPAASAKRNLSRQEELKEICITLNDAVKETGLPLVLLAQFNRKVVNVDLLHPTNIREAGDIEQIAHTLLGLWDCSQKPLNENSKKSNSKAEHLVESRESGLYLEVLKSRVMRVGACAVFDYNGNTGKMGGNKPQELTISKDEVFRGFGLNQEEEEEYDGND